MEGWIRLHRQSLESEIFASEKGWKIWTWILLKANYKERFISIKIGAGQSSIKIKRGQLLFGRFSAEHELGINGSTIYKWIKKMEAKSMISIQSSSHYTVITVCKYDEYNNLEDTVVTGKEQPSNNQVTGKEQPSNTLNKEKKDNNILDIVQKSFLDEVRAFESEYDIKMLHDFYAYWSEPTKNKKKIRKDLEKTWDTKRRLLTWFNRSRFNK